MNEEKLIRFLLWWLEQPNSYIDNTKPIELLGTDNERIVSLVKVALHPTDAF